MLNFSWPFKTEFVLRPSGLIVKKGAFPLIVAEIGGNHGGDPQKAETLMAAAIAAGARAVKFQAYQVDNFITPTSPYYNEFENEQLDFEVFKKLAPMAGKAGAAFGITVFDPAGLELAERINADFIKISSGDIDHHPLLREAALLKRPIFLSSGASEESEIIEALKVLAEAGATEALLLLCTSLYPCPLEEAALGQLEAWLKGGFLAGFSDHTLGLEAALTALSLGAVAVEKHFTDDPARPGGDNEMSIVPAQLERLAKLAPKMNLLLGGPSKLMSVRERAVQPLIRRVVTARRDLRQGDILSLQNASFRRPAIPPEKNVLRPKDWLKVAGRALAHDVQANEPLLWVDLV